MSSAAPARLFIALELDAAPRRALGEWAAEPVARLGLRALAEEQMHVTLAFLGARPSSQVPALARIVAARAAGTSVAGLALGAPLWLPQRAPRVLAVAIEDGAGAIEALHRQLRAALASEGLEQRDERSALLPHVSVARGRPRGAAREPLPRSPVSADFGASTLTLFRSHTLPSGARYEALACAELATVAGPATSALASATEPRQMRTGARRSGRSVRRGA